MRYTLIVFFLINCIPGYSQKLSLRDYSIGYRIGEGEAGGSTAFTIPAYLKNSSPFVKMIESINFNSLYGQGAPVTYHRIFAQGIFEKNSPSRFWRTTTIGAGINYTFREKRNGIIIENNERYSSIDTVYGVKRITLGQRQSFAGVHASINRLLLRGKKLRLLSGLWLQGNVAIRHRYPLVVDTGRYNRQGVELFLQRQVMPDLKGRNFFQYAILIPLALEIDIYKNRFFIKPEISGGIESNRYLRSNYTSKESLNAALWFIYRRK